MSAPGAAALPAAQASHGASHATALWPTLAGALIVAAVALAGLLLALYVHLRRRRRPVRAEDEQRRAVAVMDELCPHGWQAQITLYGEAAPVPADAPAEGQLVEVEWKQFDEQTGRVAVARRAWAQTIPQALQAMIDDRHAELTLEQIERAAGDEGLWPL